MTAFQAAAGAAAEPAGLDRRGPIRLRTLVLVRWIALAGQAATLVGVYYGLGLELPIGPGLAAVGVSALFNLAVGIGRPPGTLLGPSAATVHLGYDILQLSALLALTGGLTNPFAILLLGPVTVSATVLPRANTVGLGTLTGVCVTLLEFVNLPMPLAEPFQPPGLYVAGLWVALVLAILFIGGYVGSVAAEARRMSAALSATQMALARERQFSALGALAAAAAHELGSPLSTIAVTAREMARELPAGSPLAADVDLLIGQSDRCREILAALARSPETPAAAPFDRIPISALVAAAAEPHQDSAVELVIVAGPRDGDPEPPEVSEPMVARSPEVIHGLGNLIQNAIQHARARVEVELRWTASDVTVTVRDDGPGFAGAIRDRLGDPYVSHDGGRRGGGGEEHMGLGIFIARTLLARTGARVAFANRGEPGVGVGSGAEVAVGWSRAALEADVAAKPEEPPAR